MKDQSKTKPNRNRTNEEWKKDIVKLEGNKYISLTPYVNYSTHVLMKHTKCGFEYKVTPSVFYNGRRCPYCANNINFTTEDIKKRIFEEVQGEYYLNSEYDSMHKKVQLVHKTCGRTYLATPATFFYNKSRCPHCFGNNVSTTDKFKKRVSEADEGKEYKVLGEYINNKTKILIKHLKCGNKYMVQPKDFTKENGNRCPKCSKETRSEKFVRRFLTNIGFEVKSEVKFDDLKGISGKQPLRFDFCMESEQGDILLEVDGYYHRNSPEGDKKVEIQKANDKLKDNYCKENGLTLIRIKDISPKKGWKENIELQLNTHFEI